MDQGLPVNFFDRGARPERAESERPASRPGFWLAVMGVVLLAAGQLVEQASYVDLEGRWHEVRAQNSDGFLALLAAAGLAAALRYRPMVSSGYRAVQLLPLVLGALSALSALNGYRTIVTYHDPGLGLWASLVGGALAGAAGVAATLIWLRNPTHPHEPGLAISVEGAFEAVLAGLGALAALAGWLAVIGRPTETMWLGVVLVLLGPVVTLWLWQKMLDRLGVGRRHPPAS